jgi:hypothetical protein
MIFLRNERPAKTTDFLAHGNRKPRPQTLMAAVKRAVPSLLIFGNDWPAVPSIIDGMERENWLR